MAQNEDIDEEEQLNNKDATKESREAAKALDSMTDIVRSAQCGHQQSLWVLHASIPNSIPRRQCLHVQVPEKQIDENKAAQVRSNLHMEPLVHHD
jgi:hypothetical protein